MTCDSAATAAKSGKRPLEGGAIPYDTTTTAPIHAPQRAKGRAHLVARRRERATVLRDLAMSGSAKLLFPRPSGAGLDAVFLNSAGGVTGGDEFSLSVAAEPGAHVRLSTQAAERIYRADPDSAPGRIDSHLTLEAGATLHWLPQETILYDGAALDRRLRIEMAGDARLVACETLIFGRAAMGEVVHDLRLRDRIDLIRGGRLIFADQLELCCDAAEQLARPGVGNGGAAVASLVIAAPDAETLLDPLRDLLPETAGASALDDDLLFLRIVAIDGFELRRALIPALRLATRGDLPRPWML